MKKNQATWIFTATKISALLLLSLSAEASSGWDCKQAASGEWVCGGGKPADPVPPPAVVTPLEPAFQPESAPPKTTQPDSQTSEPAPVIVEPASKIQTPPISNETTQTPATNTESAAPQSTSETAPASLANIAESHATLPDAWCRATESMSIEVPFTDRNVNADLEADKASGTATARHLDGNVVLVRADQRIEANSMTHNALTNEVSFADDFLYIENGLAIAGKRGKMNLNTDDGLIEQAQYRLPLHSVNGVAEEIALEGRTKIHLKKSTYSTCNPDSPFWTVKSKQLTLDKEAGKGTARNATLNIKGIPVFYSPYYSFPLSKERTSGLITPRIAHSSKSGMEYSLPYYWNIAPNRDAITGLHHFINRGTMLDTNYRYLQPESHGEFTGSFLQDDDLTQSDRWSASYQHQNNYWPRLDTRVNLNQVSDDNYFSDFSNSVQTTSILYLDNEISSTYSADNWMLGGRALAFQELDAVKQYELLPEVFFEGGAPIQGSNFDLALTSQVSNFTKDSSSIEGTRVDLMPRLQYNWDQLAYYVRPAVSARYTQYSLDNVTASADTSPNRSVPTFSLDSTLFFEREFSMMKESLVQTLEPQLFYLYTPSEDHTDIPIFDTSETALTYAELFRENRFSAADRVGDANQLTSALTTRFLNFDSGYEYGLLSVGQQFYFSDREVTLNNTTPITEPESDIFVLGTANLTSSISTATDIQWNPDNSRPVYGNAGVSYRPEGGDIYNLDYRYRDGALEQVDLSFLMPISQNWKLIGRWNQSLLENRPLETLAGLQYDSCCWMFRFVHRRYVQDAEISGVDPGTEESIFFQIVLKGLGGLGDDLESVLEQGILGYQHYSY